MAPFFSKLAGRIELKFGMLIDLDETQAGNPHLPGVRLEGQGPRPKIGPKMAKNQVFNFWTRVSTISRRATKLEVVSFERGDFNLISYHRQLFTKMHSRRATSARSLKIWQKSKNSGCPQENPCRSRRELRREMGSTVLERGHPRLQSLLRHFWATVTSRRDTRARTSRIFEGGYFITGVKIFRKT